MLVNKPKPQYCSPWKSVTSLSVFCMICPLQRTDRVCVLANYLYRKCNANNNIKSPFISGPWSRTRCTSLLIPAAGHEDMRSWLRSSVSTHTSFGDKNFGKLSVSRNCVCHNYICEQNIFYFFCQNVRVFIEMSRWHKFHFTSSIHFHKTRPRGLPSLISRYKKKEERYIHYAAPIFYYGKTK